MDALRRDDIQRALNTPLAVRARQAIDAMELGIRLKAASLRQRHPDESEAQIQVRLQRWLARDE